MHIPIPVTECEAVLTLTSTSLTLTLTTIAESSIVVVVKATVVVVESSVVVVVVESSIVIIAITTASTMGNITSQVEQVAQTKESVVDVGLSRSLPLLPPVASATSSGRKKESLVAIQLLISS